MHSRLKSQTGETHFTPYVVGVQCLSLGGWMPLAGIQGGNP